MYINSPGVVLSDCYTFDYFARLALAQLQRGNQCVGGARNVSNYAQEISTIKGVNTFIS